MGRVARKWRRLDRPASLSPRVRNCKGAGQASCLQVGSITVLKPDDIHKECGGPDGAVVHYSARGTGMLFEVLDDSENVLGGLTLESRSELARAAFRGGP